MALSDPQVEQLFAFTLKKSVRYYDLQVELVDHLASSIEEEMADDSNLSFDQALQKVYNRFGIFGFAKVVQEREAALLRSNRKIWLKAAGQFFNIPKVALTAAIFFAALFVGNYLPAESKGIIVSVVWFAFTLVEVRHMRRARKESVRNLLLTQYTTFFSFSGFLFPYYIFVPNPTISNNYVFAFLVIAVVIIESAVIEVNQQVRKKARELYPEAFRLA
jgi:hypothetical protein